MSSSEEIRPYCIDELIESHESWERLCGHKAEIIRCDDLIRKNPHRKDIRMRRDLQRKEADSIQTQILDEIFSEADVVCTTCVSAYHRSLRGRQFHFALVDECTQSIEPAVLICLTLGVEKMVLVGDHEQLPPMINSKRADLLGFGVSLFERLVKAGLRPTMLDVQYRMHPEIAKFPSKRFYGERLKTDKSCRRRPIPKCIAWKNPKIPVMFVNHIGRENTTGQGSKDNLGEANIIRDLVKNCLESTFVGRSGEDGVKKEGDQSGVETPSIGIISPYSGQVKLLRRIIPTDLVEIATVDGFQGREMDIIFMTTVRSNSRKEVGFLADKRRLNVAITRCRTGLVIVGDASTLEADRDWRAWIEWAEKEDIITGDKILRNKGGKGRGKQKQKQQRRNNNGPLNGPPNAPPNNGPPKRSRRKSAQPQPQRHNLKRQQPAGERFARSSKRRRQGPPFPGPPPTRPNMPWGPYSARPPPMYQWPARFPTMTGPPPHRGGRGGSFGIRVSGGHQQQPRPGINHASSWGPNAQQPGGYASLPQNRPKSNSQ